MAHSKEAHGKHAAMKEFNEGHWEKKPGEPGTSDLKYTDGEMNKPENLKRSEQSLASYVKKNKMKY